MVSLTSYQEHALCRQEEIMYLLIFEDGTIKGDAKWHPDWDDSVNAGVLDVIDLGPTKFRPAYRKKGLWHEVPPTNADGF